MTGKEFLNSLAKGKTDILQLLLDPPRRSSNPAKNGTSGGTDLGTSQRPALSRGHMCSALLHYEVT